MKALALEHLASDPIGVFGDVLAERGIDVDRVRLHDGEALPDWRGYDFVVAMGAGASVWQEDEYPWLADEKRLVREAVLDGTPYFGVCFGVQLLADVFGGRSFRGPEPEIGVNQVFLTAAAQHDPVFRGFPADLEVCEWHSNHFSLPPGAVRLARSPRYENQAIRYGQVAYGMQCHLEPSLQDIRAWLEESPDSAVVFEERHGRGALDRLLADYADFVPFLQQTARQAFGRWLENALVLGARSGAAPSSHRASGVPAGGEVGVVGRLAELSRIDAALAAARRGESAVLVLRGESGIGKSALLNIAARHARGLTVLRTAGELADDVEPLAALADLCRPVGDRREALSPARAAAAAPILDRQPDGPARDRFAVYAAAFDLLVTAAADSPLLLLIDDAHLLDEASHEAVAFIAQRLGTDGIAVLAATESEHDLAFAEDLRLGGLEPPDARALLERSSSRELAPAVVDAIVAAGAGNPLALLQILAGLTCEQRAGAVPIEGTLPASAEWAFLNRVLTLSAPARQALVVAALAGRRDQDAVAASWRALGLEERALEEARTSGLIQDDGSGPRFLHPLARAVVSYSALRADRRAAHAALAAATAGDSRTWHLARAATHADESIASELEQIARCARDRTAFAAAAAAFERAARLTPDGEACARRLLDAARAAHLAGHVNASLDFIAAALRDATEEVPRREAEYLRGRIIARGGSAALARDQLVSLAGRYERAEPQLAAHMLADAVLPALRAGSPAEAVDLARRSERLSANAGNGATRSIQVAAGTALIFAGDYLDGVRRLDAAAQEAERASNQEQLAYLGAGLAFAGRHDAARRVLAKAISEARSTGTISILPYALIRLADTHLEMGRWAAAAAALHEAGRLAGETGQPADRGLALGSLAWLAGARGDAADCRAYAEEALRIAERLGGGSRLDRAGTAIAMLELGRGRPAEAIANLEEVCRLQDEQGWSDAARTPHRRPDLVEAYALAGQVGEARAALAPFLRDAEHSRRPSALAAVARCHALLAPPSELDDAFTAARGAGRGAWGPFDHGRTDLLYGLRLVELDRRSDAVDILIGALRTFEELGAQSWAERARSGILGAGGTPPAPRLTVAERLTPGELEVALAAAEGASPAVIADRLILGPRSVQMQLASAAIKLGLDSPAALAGSWREGARLTS